MSSPSFSILAEVQMSQGWDLGLSGFTLATNFFLAWLHSEHNDLVPRIPNCLTTPPPNSALCCGVRMTSGSSKPLHVTVITPGELLLCPFLSQTLLKGKGNGGGGKDRTAHFNPNFWCRHTWRTSLLPRASRRQGPSPCNSPASLKQGPAPSPTKRKETRALSLCPYPTTPPASLSCCSPWKFAIFPR